MLGLTKDVLNKKKKRRDILMASFFAAFHAYLFLFQVFFLSCILNLCNLGGFSLLFFSNFKQFAPAAAATPEIYCLLHIKHPLLSHLFNFPFSIYVDRFIGDFSLVSSVVLMELFQHNFLYFFFQSTLQNENFCVTSTKLKI